jgi:hypothetical protein
MIPNRTLLVVPFLLSCVLSANQGFAAMFEWFPNYSNNQSALAGGCTDMGACNYDPAASFDDGSCCYSNCFTLTITASTYPLEVGYVLENSDGIEFLNIPSNGASQTHSLCLPNGCYIFHQIDAFGDGWNGATYTLAYSGGGATVSSGNFPNIPAYEAWDKYNYFLIGTGVLGCDDPVACNYEPTATCNNGTCDYTSCYGCTNPVACNYSETATFDDGSCCISNCLTLEMIDYVGDGWDDGIYLIEDFEGNIIASGTLAYPLDYDIVHFCLPDGCYFFSVEGSGYPEEIEWIITDGDGNVYNGDGLTVTSANFGLGSGECYGCTDPTACTYNPFAIIDDGSCINGPCVAYDNPWTARPTTLTNYPTCTSFNMTLIGATTTSISDAPVITGEDVWMSFAPNSNAGRFTVSSSTSDIVLELLDENYSTITSVNLKSGVGNEILNYGGFVAGNTYYLGIRNYNSALGTGSVTVCAMNLRSTTCDVAAGPKHLNQSYKAAFTGTYSYKFDFIDQADESVHSYTTVSSSVFLLWNVPGLQYGHTYDVEISAVYSLSNSIGQTEIIFADPGAVCSQSIEIINTQAIPVSFNCVNYGPISPNTWISFGPYVSGASGHELEFVNTNGLEAPVYKTIGTTRLFKLRDVVGISGGNSYNVRCRPTFANGYSVNWGPSTCITMASLSNFFTITNNFDSDLQYSESISEVEQTFTGKIFPNPSDGKQFNLAFVTNEEKLVNVAVYDLMGKLVHKQQVNLVSDMNVEITPKVDLANGLYNIYLTSGEETYIEKLIVTKQ